MEIKRTGVQRKYHFSELKKGHVYRDDKEFNIFIAVKGRSISGVVSLEDGHFYTPGDMPNIKFQIVEASVLVESE